MKARDKKEQAYRDELAHALAERRAANRGVRDAVASWATSFCYALDSMSRAAVSVIDNEPFLAGLVRPSAPPPPQRISHPPPPPVKVRAPHE